MLSNLFHKILSLFCIAILVFPSLTLCLDANATGRRPPARVIRARQAARTVSRQPTRSNRVNRPATRANRTTTSRGRQKPAVKPVYRPKATTRPIAKAKIRSGTIQPKAKTVPAKKPTPLRVQHAPQKPVSLQAKRNQLKSGTALQTGTVKPSVSRNNPALKTGAIKSSGTQAFSGNSSLRQSSHKSAAVTVKFSSPKVLNRKYDRHAKDFGLTGNRNNQNLTKFKQAIQRHIDHPQTRVIYGTYRKKEPVIHFYNHKTGINMFMTKKGEFRSAWKLDERQLKHLKKHGNVQ